MTCGRCGNVVPPDRMACSCYILRADAEARTLALRRFFASESPVFLHRDGHVYPDRRQCVSMCGQEVLTNKKDDWKNVKAVKGTEFDPGEIGCEKCREVVMAAAGKD